MKQKEVVQYGLQVQSSFIDIATAQKESLVIKNQQSIISCDLETASSQYPEIMKDYSIPKNARGIFILIPKDVVVQEHIWIGLNSLLPQDERVIIIAEENSVVTIIQEALAKERLHSVDVVVKENAIVKIIDIQNVGKQRSIKRAKIAKGAEVQWFDCMSGSFATHTRTTSILEGEGASAQHYSVVIAKGEEQYDCHSIAIHTAPNTNSKLIGRAVLHDSAKVIHKGLIHMHSQAGKSKGYQKEEMLLLSTQAEAVPLPELQIDTNDVQCSHGASVGQINDQVLFYLMSRGMDEIQAQQVIIQGFFSPLLDLLDKEARQRIQLHMEATLCKV